MQVNEERSNSRLEIQSSIPQSTSLLAELYPSRSSTTCRRETSGR